MQEIQNLLDNIDKMAREIILGAEYPELYSVLIEQNCIDILNKMREVIPIRLRCADFFGKQGKIKSTEEMKYDVYKQFEVIAKYLIEDNQDVLDKFDINGKRKEMKIVLWNYCKMVSSFGRFDGMNQPIQNGTGLTLDDIKNERENITTEQKNESGIKQKVEAQNKSFQEILKESQERIDRVINKLNRMK